MMGIPVPPSRKLIHVKAQFIGYHCWPDAPEEVAFLRDIHRHNFHVEVHMDVQHNDRELEFFLVQDFLLRGPLEDLRRGTRTQQGELVTWSCEKMAEDIGQRLLERYTGRKYLAVGVYEDGENGGVALWELG